MTLAFRYVLFAIVSTIVNFAVQELSLSVAPFQPLMLSILLGTAAGFIVKYVLDKKWIFFDGYTSKSNEAKKVSLYGMFSILTTVIFWSFEVAFWTIWGTTFAKYAGGALGLAIGYAVKYALDRKFVFRPEGA